MEDPILSYDQIIKLDTADMLIELKRKLQNKLQITAAGQPPNILDYYKKHAAFVDDEDLKMKELKSMSLFQII